jgi:hypothetical protein
LNLTLAGLHWFTWIKKRYVNGGWAEEAAFDPASSSYVGFIGGGQGSVASGSVADLASVPQANVTILGTSTIASFGSAAREGIVKIVRFAGALTLTYSSALPTPCGADLVTAANDRAIVTHLGSGNWEFTAYTRASGIAIDCSAVGRLQFTMAETVPPLHVAAYGQPLTRSSYPAYLAKVTRAQNGTRTSGNATIASVANTAGLGAGMPVEGTGIAAGCTIASVVANTSITLNSSACVTSSGTSTVTVFLTGYGTGGTNSTVGAPDCRGRGLAGRDRNDLGSYADKLTTGFFGADSKVFNVRGGREDKTLSAVELAAHNHGVFLNDPGHTHPYQKGQADGSQKPAGTGSSPHMVDGGATTTSNTTGITVRDTSGGGGTANQTASAGSSTPFSVASPFLVAECVIRVTP